MGITQITDVDSVLQRDRNPQGNDWNKATIELAHKELIV